MLKKSLLFLVFSFPAFATPHSSQVHCFQFDKKDLPEWAHQETWCYQQKSLGKQKYLFLFQFDQKESPPIQPELSALLLLNSDLKPIKMTIGQKIGDKIRYQTLPRIELNPFGIPLSIFDAQKNGKKIKLNLNQWKTLLDDLWLKLNSNVTFQSTPVIKPGVLNASIPKNKFPFNGFWWSRAGLPMASGSNSPLGIYDQYQKVRTGKNPDSVSWEAQNHSGSAAEWGGHCNGWVASSLLYPEPTQTLFDPLTGAVITPYAQKGMLAEASYCVRAAFYGTRYEGPEDDIRDVYPDVFHHVLTYYIGELGSAVAMDYVPNAAVDNHIITGYRFDIQSRDVHVFHVDAELTVAGYDIEQRDSLGPAKTYLKKYSYTLVTNEKNEVISGEWDATSDNPDFLWIPLGAAKNCGSMNPKVNISTVKKIIQNLPQVSPVELQPQIRVVASLYPQLQIPLAALLPLSDGIEFQYTVNSVSGTGLQWVISGAARYPITGGINESVFIPLSVGTHVVKINRLLSITNSAIVNPSLTNTTAIDFSIDYFRYFNTK